MKLNRLNQTTLDTLQAGEHADGLGLYLIVKPTGGRSWMFKFTWAGEKKKMGLGSAALISLEQARSLTLDAHKLINAGSNPLVARTKKPEQRSSPRFLDYAREVIKIKSHGQSKKSAESWVRAIEIYAKSLHKMELATITKHDVQDCLTPIWLTLPPTALNVRSKLEAIFRYAIANDDLMISHDRNPAKAETLRELLPKQPASTGKGHTSLPYLEMPAFFSKLQALDTTSARTLEFCILTCVRTNEAVQLRWEQLDLDAGEWVIPETVMKNGLPANVPLSSDAIALLRRIQALHNQAGIDTKKGYVFRGQDPKTCQGESTLLKLLQDTLGYDVTVHGFRTTFRSWTQNQTSHDGDTLEYCLHHITGDAAEAAYKKGDMWHKRQVALQDWADAVNGRAPIEPNKRRAPARPAPKLELVA